MLNKRAFTIIELVIAIAIIGILMGIIIANITSTKDKATIQQNLSMDIKNIINAITEIKSSKLDINIENIEAFSNLNSMDNKSLTSNNIDCNYYIDTDTIIKSGDSIKIFVECQNLDEKSNKYAEKTVVSKINQLTNSKTEIEYKATGIGKKSEHFETNNGSSADGKVGIRKIKI